jgi:hypothetical protein
MTHINAVISKPCAWHMCEKLSIPPDWYQRFQAEGCMAKLTQPATCLDCKILQHWTVLWKMLDGTTIVTLHVFIQPLARVLFVGGSLSQIVRAVAQ